MMTSPSFRETVATVAARAREVLPTDAAGRIDAAVKLVLSHDVNLLEDGSIEVGSLSDPLKTYRVDGPTCTCIDFTQGKAPASMCKHRIAANLQTSVERVLARLDAALLHVKDAQPWQGNAPEPELMEETPPMQTPTQTQPQPLPEARSSANVRLRIGGHEVQITLRDHDEGALMGRLEALLERYGQPPAQPTPQQAEAEAAKVPRPMTGLCAVHNVEMKSNEKNGQRWFSHWDEQAGRWCKGR